MKIIEVKIVSASSETVRARADVHFDGFWLNGFKILQDLKTGKEYVTPPSYKAGSFWRPLFRTDSPDDWKLLHTKILKEFRDHEIKLSVDEIKETPM